MVVDFFIKTLSTRIILDECSVYFTNVNIALDYILYIARSLKTIKLIYCKFFLFDLILGLVRQATEYLSRPKEESYIIVHWHFT